MKCREKTRQPYDAYSFLLVLLTACIPFSGTAQYNSMLYAWKDNDVKNYTTRYIPGASTTRESVMAGTMFDQSTGLGVPHFIKCDDGNPTNYYPGITAEKKYPHPDFVDQRVVDIISVQPNEHYIIALARQGVTPITPPINDMIRIIKVDDNGDNTGSGYGELLVNDLNFGLDNLNIYPMSAMIRTTFHPGLVRDVKALYICGFVSEDITAYPDYPDMHSEKRSFILAIEIGDPADAAGDTDPSAWTFMNANYFESSPCTGPFPGCSVNSPELDWDIAMHMQTLEHAASNVGDIFMTGSVNAKTGPYNGYPHGYTFVRSASMVKVLDPYYLTNTSGNPNPDNIVHLGNGDGYGRMEYGVALVENATTGDDLYLVSNMYDDYPGWGDGRLSDDWVNTTSFNEKPGYMMITHMNQNFESRYLTSSLRLTLDQDATHQYSGLYALDVLPSLETPTSAGGSEVSFIIAGMAYTKPRSNDCNTNVPLGHRAISQENMLPFLYNLDISWTKYGGANPNSYGTVNYIPSTGYISASPQGSFITLYPTLAGTGDPAMVPNAYANLGGGLSHIAWAPNFAAIADPLDPDNSIIMNAPVWTDRADADGTVSGQGLGLKTFFVNRAPGQFLTMNATGPSNGTNCPYLLCIPHAQTEELEVVDNTDVVPDIDIIDEYEGYSSTIKIPVGDCRGIYSAALPPVYKPTGVQQLDDTRSAIYPNPAGSSLHVQLAKNITGKVHVELLNIYGQVIGVLYQGDANGLKSSQELKLPAVASGLYMVKVFANGQLVHNEKLSVQQ